MLRIRSVPPDGTGCFFVQDDEVDPGPCAQFTDRADAELFVLAKTMQSNGYRIMQCANRVFVNSPLKGGGGASGNSDSGGFSGAPYEGKYSVVGAKQLLAMARAIAASASDLDEPKPDVVIGGEP